MGAGMHCHMHCYNGFAMYYSLVIYCSIKHSICNFIVRLVNERGAITVTVEDYVPSL